ncbi:MAG TPA: hypothetical protein VF495_05795 [Phenylobacterium sp.]|jgi:hypothetical protein
MAPRQVDPARLQGDELRQWYLRSPQDIEREKREAEARKHAEFVAGIHENEREPEGAHGSPLDQAVDAFHDWQHGPKMSRPNLAESFIPVVGPAWEAAADLQDGNYAGAGFNGAMAVADVLPVGVAAKGLKAASKGIGILKEGSVTADAARKALRKVGMAKPGQEIHHTVPLDGLGRNVQDWRNHYAFLKPLPREQHRRLTGSWMGKPEYDPIRKVWYGTTDWMKAVPTGVAGYATDTWENLARPFQGPPPAKPRR